MLIRIASGNPIKLSAIAKVMQPIFPQAQFEPRAVASGVSDQPLGLEETMAGAKNRARSAFTLSPSCQLAVALESGLIPVPHTRTGHMNLTACAIFDGREMFLGLGPAFELPEEITRLVVQEGWELDPAVRQVGLTTNKRIGYDQGLIGLLSQGRVTREEYSYPAVSMALVAMGI